MQSAAFAAATRPTLRKILRCWLQPYSLGHELLLIAENNPLLWVTEYFDTLPVEQRCFAILRAVPICSRTWEENHRPDRNLRLWHWLIRKCDMLKACQEFRDYRNAGTTCPQMKKGDRPESEHDGSPFTAQLLAYGASVFGDSVFDKPMGMLQWMYFAQLEREGDCKVKNAFQLQLEAETRQHQEDYAREQKEKQCQH